MGLVWRIAVKLDDVCNKLCPIIVLANRKFKVIILGGWDAEILPCLFCPIEHIFYMTLALAKAKKLLKRWA